MVAAPPVNSQNNPTAQIITNQIMPKEGPKCIPLGFNFSTAASFDMNLINFQNLGRISIIQGAWIDNSANANPVIISNNATGQNVICPPFWQGYFAILAVNPVDLIITSTIGNVNVNVTLYNVPIAPNAWPASALSAQGTLPVQDVALEAALIGNTLGSTQFNYSSADIVRRTYKADKTITAKITTAATTTLLTGSPGFFIDWVDITLGPTAIIGAAALVTCSLIDDAGPTTIMQRDLWIPNAAANGSPIPIFDIDPGMNWNSKGTTSHLLLVMGTALTGGTISVNLGAAINSQNT